VTSRASLPASLQHALCDPIAAPSPVSPRASYGAWEGTKGISHFQPPGTQPRRLVERCLPTKFLFRRRRRCGSSGGCHWQRNLEEFRLPAHAGLLPTGGWRMDTTTMKGHRRLRILVRGTCARRTRVCSIYSLRPPRTKGLPSTLERGESYFPRDRTTAAVCQTDRHPHRATTAAAGTH